MNYNQLKNSLKKAFDEIKLRDKDSLHDRIIDSVLTQGVDGLEDVVEDISPKLFQMLKESVNDLFETLNINFKSTNFKIKNYIVDFLKNFKIDDDLQFSIIHKFIEDFTNKIEHLRNEINFEKLNKLLREEIDKEIKPIEYNSIESNLRSFLKDNHITDDENLINELIYDGLKCFHNSIDEFKDEIPPKIFNQILKTIQLKEKISYNVETQKIENNFGTNKIILDSKKISNLKELIKSMPECLERTVLKMIFYIHFKIYPDEQKFESHKIENSHLYKQINVIISNELELLKKRLSAEANDNETLRQYFDEIQKNIYSDDWNSALKNLETFLKQIRPIDVFELKFLIEKAREAADKIKNQDIILLLGKTGSGKSTTIHFLSGSKMVNQKVEIEKGKFIDHITPVKPYPNRGLNNVVSSSKAKLETRYINPIFVNLKDIGGHKDKTVIICDSPGFGDTAGVEVDIANGIGIIEAIHECNSVKPVILFSYLRIGDRGEGIRDLAHFMVNMVHNVKDYLSSFSYIFTKFPPGKDIHAELLNIYDSIEKFSSSKESNDDLMMIINSIIIDILEKTENDIKALDPINDKPYKVLKNIINTNCIKNPKVAFKFTITSDSEKLIHEHIRLLQLSIHSAIERKEYLFISHKLDELIFLKDNLNQDFIKNIYNECVSFIINKINKTFIKTIEMFNSYLERDNKLANEDVVFYKNQVEKFKGLESFKNIESLAEIRSKSDALIQNLKFKFIEISEKMEKDDLINSNNKITLDNLKLISSCFPELISNYEFMCQNFLMRIKNVKEELNNDLKANDFNKAAEKLNTIHKTIELYEGHIDSNVQEGSIFDASVCIIENHLLTVSNKNNEILMRGKLNENDIDNIKNDLKILDNARETVGFIRFIHKEILDGIYDSFIIKLVNYFNELITKVKENKDSFKSNELFMKQIDYIRSIPIIELKTSEKFHSTLQELFGKMKQIEKETEELLKDLNDGKNIEYSNVYKNLIQLKEAEWIKIGPKRHSYDEIIKNIEDKIAKYASKLQEEILDLDLGLLNYKNLEISFKKIEKLEDLSQFEQTIPNLGSFKQNAINKFNSSVDCVQKYIKETFNLKNQSVNTLDFKLNDLYEIKKEYNSLQQSSDYFKENGFKTIDELKLTISELEKKRKTDNEQINELKINLKKLKEILTDMKMLNEISRKKIGDIEKDIKYSEDEIEMLTNEVQKTEIQLEKLNKIIYEYHNLLNINEPSKEAQDFISKTKYKTIQKLENEIKIFENEINCSNTQGNQYKFDRMDLKTAEYSLNYLNTCCKIRLIRENSYHCKNDLEKYIKYYRDYIQTESKYLLNEIENLKSDKKDFAFGFAQRLKTRLVELKEIEENKENKYQKLKSTL